MTQALQVTTKALSAYLQKRHASFSAAIHMLGMSQKLLDQEFVSDDTLGRVARLYGMQPAQLAAMCTPYETPKAPEPAPPLTPPAPINTAPPPPAPPTPPAREPSPDLIDDKPPIIDL